MPTLGADSTDTPSTRAAAAAEESAMPSDSFIRVASATESALMVNVTCTEADTTETATLSGVVFAALAALVFTVARTVSSKSSMLIGEVNSMSTAGDSLELGEAFCATYELGEALGASVELGDAFGDPDSGPGPVESSYPSYPPYPTYPSYPAGNSAFGTH